jgi:hypothetical protein
MKTTFDLPDELVEEVKLHAVNEGKKKDAMADLLRKGLDLSQAGSATVVKADKAMLKRRAALTAKFVAGEWGVELADYEANRDADRKAAARARKWRK